MIDYLELADALREMKPGQRLCELVKAEVKRRGHWKAALRGRKFEKGFDIRRGSL